MPNVEQVINDPDFHKLPIPKRLEILRADPDFSNLDPKVQGKILDQADRVHNPMNISDEPREQNFGTQLLDTIVSYPGKIVSGISDKVSSLGNAVLHPVDTFESYRKGQEDTSRRFAGNIGTIGTGLRNGDWKQAGTGVLDAINTGISSNPYPGVSIAYDTIAEPVGDVVEGNYGKAVGNLAIQGSLAGAARFLPTVLRAGKGAVKGAVTGADLALEKGGSATMGALRGTQKGAYQAFKNEPVLGPIETKAARMVENARARKIADQQLIQEGLKTPKLEPDFKGPKFLQPSSAAKEAVRGRKPEAPKKTNTTLLQPSRAANEAARNRSVVESQSAKDELARQTAEKQIQEESARIRRSLLIK